jgi:hypothetical protein
VQETLPYSGLMKNTFLALGALLVIIGFSGCQHAPRRGDATSPRSTFRLPTDVARDPTARLLFMERMRVQVLQKTGGIDPSEQRATRARIFQDLIAGGLDRQEADYILTGLDQPTLAIQQASAR